MIKYQLLDRYLTDCKYFLKAGNAHEKHLYFENVERHISEMLKLQNELRPEWLTRSDIIDYGRKMIYYRDIKRLFAADKYCFGYLG